MIQLALFEYHASLLDDYRADEAEEDLRDAVVLETGRVRFDTCSTEELQECAEWLASEEERADRAIDERPDWLREELEEALKEKMFDHLRDMRELEPRNLAAE